MALAELGHLGVRPSLAEFLEAAVLRHVEAGVGQLGGALLVSYF